MKYRFYAYSYECGWELYTILYKEESIVRVINELDRYEYGQYIIVKETKDRDEIYDMGFLYKPKSMKLKKENKKK